MSNNYYVIFPLAMDLKRVVLAYLNNSEVAANRFAEESLKRLVEIDINEVIFYIFSCLKQLPSVLKQKDKQKISEDALMCATIF